MSHSAPATQEAPPLWRGLLPLIVFSALATQDAVVTAFGDACKPIALFALNILGLTTRDEGLIIMVEHLQVPWTRDCAGMNLLLVLLAVFAWMNRHGPQDRSYWFRMLMMVPAAIAANVLRVLSLVAYRFAVYPEVESPQLHYFLGFLWLVPFALLAIPRNTERPKKALWFELLHISAVIGLLAPLLSLSNHWVTAGGALFCLIHCRFSDVFTKKSVTLLAVWTLAAAAIAWSGIESLWLPWLLVCPLLANSKWLLSPAGLACLAASCPLFVLLPGATFIAGAIFAYSAFKVFRNAQDEDEAYEPNRLSRLWERSLTTALSPLLILPFLSAVLFSTSTNELLPPSSAEKRIIKGMGYELRLPGQPAGLGLLWYDAQGSDRHHAVEVCLQYRGIHLEDAEVENIKTDGTYWFKEFFLVRNELIPEHREYLWHTFGFRRDPGVHLILIADSYNFTAEAFSQKATATAEKLYTSLQ